MARDADAGGATVTRIHVDHDHESWVTGEADPADEWSKERSATIWSVNGLAIRPDGQVAADFPVSPGDTLHLVYATYSTGDSFCSHQGEGIEFFTVHKDKARTERNAAVLRAWPNARKEHWDDSDALAADVGPGQLMTDGGVALPVQVPWGVL